MSKVIGVQEKKKILEGFARGLQAIVDGSGKNEVLSNNIMRSKKMSNQNTQNREVTEIILDKKGSLAKKLEEFRAKNNQVDEEKVRDFLLDIDNYVACIKKYDPDRLTDPNNGHWDIYRNPSNKPEEANRATFYLNQSIMARSPSEDVDVEKTVAIDFGTKSTIAGVARGGDSHLICIGAGDDSENEGWIYENPTIVEFQNIDKFLTDYNSSLSRPLTSWNDMVISHQASDRFLNASKEDFYHFFSELKQWVVNGKKQNIQDQNGIRELKEFARCGECADKDLDPIEVYAYYIGRYINNMWNGICLDYILSYPVKYPSDIREKVRASFERGIKKSIPHGVLSNSKFKDKFKVQLAASEPAAYAISALKEYGFYDEEFWDKKTYYGIFDFGGGTTDFDFGIWSGSENDEDYDFDLKHFGNGGDKDLGGENLLKKLSFEILKDNREKIKDCDCSFELPARCEEFDGSRGLITNSPQAKYNLLKLASNLRPFVENLDILDALREGDESIYPSDKVKFFQNLRDGKIETTLQDNNPDSPPIEETLSVDFEKLVEILKQEIYGGVRQFFANLKEATAKEKCIGVDRIHIFLGGNASRSPLVSQAFEEIFAETEEGFEYELYPPLGTLEAEMNSRRLYKKTKDVLEEPKEKGKTSAMTILYYTNLALQTYENGLRNEEKERLEEIKEELEDYLGGIQCEDRFETEELSKKRTCKTGVVFGMLDSREGYSRINIISPSQKFKFYLGTMRMGNFIVKIDRDNDIESNQPHSFVKSKESFVIYYTSNALAMGNKLKESDVSSIKIEQPSENEEYFNDNYEIKIKLVGIDQIQWEIWEKGEASKKGKACYQSNIVKLDDNQ